MVSDKVALVIGNEKYECEKLRGLFYPEKDAFDVTQVLSLLGFKVRARLVRHFSSLPLHCRHTDELYLEQCSIE